MCNPNHISSNEEAGVNHVGQQHANNNGRNGASRQATSSVCHALRGIGGAFDSLHATGALTRLRGAIGAEETGRTDAAAGLRVIRAIR